MPPVTAPPTKWARTVKRPEERTDASVDTWVSECRGVCTMQQLQEQWVALGGQVDADKDESGDVATVTEDGSGVANKRAALCGALATGTLFVVPVEATGAVGPRRRGIMHTVCPNLRLLAVPGAGGAWVPRRVIKLLGKFTVTAATHEGSVPGPPAPPSSLDGEVARQSAVRATLAPACHLCMYMALMFVVVAHALTWR